MLNNGYILIVDDEPIIVDTLRMELKEQVFGDVQVITANSGQEALSIIREEMDRGCYPAIAIVDYLMHPMKGSELLEAIEVLAPSAKKIMLTGQADLSVVKQVMSTVHLYRYMEKPWRSMDMELTVTEALRLYEMERRLREEVALLSDPRPNRRTTNMAEDAEQNGYRELSRSLSYARNIQQCFIPELDSELSAMIDLHVMDRPLAHVSGDFRWYRQYGRTLYLALGDCTGHGLAGAIIAVLATDILSNLLSDNRTLKQDTGIAVRNVLNQLRSRLVRENGHSEHIGLELTLLRIDLDEKTMSWSSLNGYLIAMDTEGNTSILSKSRGISNSGSSSHDDCRSGTMNIAGHRVLMFTDGITDQFGGALNKRLRLDGLLRMVERGEVFTHDGKCEIDRLFDAWKGDHEQVDDCIWMSFRIPSES